MMLDVSNFEGLRFVVARYKEDIEWIPGFLDKFPGSKCIVYNKGPSGVQENEYYEVENLENVGRESHTYLHHIISTYENSDDEVTVFLQAHPFDHCPDLYTSVCKCIEGIMTGSEFENVGTRVIEVEDANPRFHMSIRDDLIQTHVDLLGYPLPDRFYFSAGALIMVPRRSIRNKPLEFYRRAIDMLNSEVNPVTGFCFERLWSLVFVSRG